MRDLIEARLWGEHGQQFSRDLHRSFLAVKVTFQRLAAIRFGAPWRKLEAAGEERTQAVPDPVRVRLAGAAFSALLTTLVASLALGSGWLAAQPAIV